MAIKFSNNFLLRKLHQITGIVPLGAFFAMHMFTNAKAMNGAKVFNDAVGDIHHLPFLLFVEIFGIFLPLVFHSVYGIIISSELKANVGSYSYARNWFYIFQRVTGIFLFFFITFHLLHYRFGFFGSLGLTEVAVAGNAGTAFEIVAQDMKIFWVMVLYLFGVFATAWHLAYGIFLFAVDWGMVVGERAQKYALYACAFIGISLFGLGANAAVSFVRPCGLLPQMLCEETAHNEYKMPDGPKKF